MDRSRHHPRRLDRRVPDPSPAAGPARARSGRGLPRSARGDRPSARPVAAPDREAASRRVRGVGMTDALRSFTVVVPALNEEDNLRPTVESILKEIGPLASDLEVLVFDDASTARTGAVADELAAQDARVRAIHNPRRLNIGGSYKAGLGQA